MIRSAVCSAVLSLSALLTTGAALAQENAPSKEDARLITATQVLDELLATPDQNVPSWLLQRAYGVAIIPEVIKGAFIFGGRYGQGVMTVRDASMHFGNPIFITLVGGSVGWQLGATSTDVVLVFVTPRSVQNFARGKFTLGADASVAAGPLGRQGEAQAGVNAEIYSYSRARGLFAGVALDGTVIAFDRSANRTFYDRYNLTTDMITGGQVTAKGEAAQRFIAAVVRSANGGTAVAGEPSGSRPAAPAPAPAPQAPAAAPSPSGTHSYPMEDANPGSEPK